MPAYRAHAGPDSVASNQGYGGETGRVRRHGAGLLCVVALALSGCSAAEAHIETPAGAAGIREAPSAAQAAANRCAQKLKDC
jgi:hypothetical protein